MFLVFLVFLLRRRKRKKAAAQPAGAAGPAADAAGVPPAYAMPEPTNADAASIKADLDRMANETPESLAALLSSWLTKG